MDDCWRVQTGDVVNLGCVDQTEIAEPVVCEAVACELTIYALAFFCRRKSLPAMGTVVAY